MRFLLLSFIFVLHLNSYSQSDSTVSGFEAGLHLGVDRSILAFRLNDDFAENVTDKYSITGQNAVGFTVGLTAAWNLSDRLDQRLNIGGTINNTSLTYDFAERLPLTIDVFPIALNANSLITYSWKDSPSTWTTSAGIGILIDLPTQSAHLPGIKAHDIQAKIGFGRRAQGRFAVLNYELFYSHSLFNLIGGTDDIYNVTLRSVQRHMITLVFTGY
ncbi:MAG: hypothetical protein HKN32_06920 [Flavobacteriales bacterium]|nr:hypothetical protein [Flavobacteriales bacterium]